MNKKLLFAAMSFAALTACSTDDFESQQQVAEGVSPIQFEVINNSETTRASMDGNTIKWDANDGDLFTLYHGGTVSTTLTGYDNATYSAHAGGEGETATLTTPSMIKEGKAIMVWPVDTTFRAKSDLTIVIPEKLTNVENNIPYVSDLIDIKTYSKYTEKGKTPTAYNTAGKDRKYTVYMRPMASQLILKADYAGTDAKINALATGADPIAPIALTSVELKTEKDGKTQFTKEIALNFTEPTSDIQKRWTDAKNNNAWSHVTGFDKENVAKTGKQTDVLTTTCINGLESAKFLMLPQAALDEKGVAKPAVVVNTLYGKVIVAKKSDDAKSKYTDEEMADAWYRYHKASDKNIITGEKETKIAGTGSDAGKVRYTADLAIGMKHVIDAFSKNTTTKDGSIVKDEPTGAVGTRYVKVLLTNLDMQGLHIKNDKHLYDAVRVWNEIGAADVTVNLDGDANKEFAISQKTIAKINEINAAAAKEKNPRKFTVSACNETEDETCNTIVITGGKEIPQDLSFILDKVKTADVALNAGESWKWNSKNVTVDADHNGISKIINRGTLVSNASATLQVFDNTAKKPNQVNIEFVNDGTWDITAGTLNVQFTVTNNGTVNIAKGAQYRQDGSGNNFTNEAATLPERFFTADQKKKNVKEQIGLVNNSGVFATVNDANINNYGLIEHLEKDAKTYITTNQTGTGFGSAFADDNKMGRINLPFSNKDEDNISINAAASEGFVSVTVTSDNAPADKKLDASKVGTYVNYVIINSGIEEITNVNDQVKYIEFDDKDKKEIAWLPRFDAKTGKPIAYSYTGLIVLSDVNIKLNTEVIVTGSTYIASDMYVGGKFTYGTYKGYFGDTEDNSKTMYITY